MSRLSIELTEQQHRKIKTLAALSGQTIKQYVVERILPSDKVSDDEKIAMDELKQLLSERIKNSQSTAGSGKNIKQITGEFLENKE